MVVVLAGLFMGCPTLLSPSICYVMLCYVRVRLLMAMPAFAYNTSTLLYISQYLC